MDLLEDRFSFVEHAPFSSLQSKRFPSLLGEFITTFGGIYNCNLDHFKMTIRRDG
jgi:hypothetical protein